MNKEEYLLYSLSAIKQVIKTFDVDIEITVAKDGEKYVFNAYNEIEKCVVDYLNSLQPYKFEDLKSGIWVWDDKYEAVIFIYNLVKSRQMIFTDKYDNYIEFEEGRFFPLTKAMEGYKNG